MSSEPTFLEYAAQLQRDPLLVARNAANSGRRVVGYVGSVPVELILAAGALPVSLSGKIATLAPRADEYLEIAFVPETRAVLEQWLCGEFDFIDAVIFSRSNDSAQRLYYYICELQRTRRCAGPTPLLFDVATISRSTSLAHTIESVQQLGAVLRSDFSALDSAMRQIHARAQTLELLSASRLAIPSLSGSDAYRILRVAGLDWSPSFDASLRTWLSHVPLRKYSRRLLLVGNAPPDERLHSAVENADAVIAREFVDTSSMNDDMTTDDAVTALARRHHLTLAPAQRMLRTPNCLVELARSIAADGVIFWAIEEDEMLPWEVARQTNMLRAAKMPVLSLTRQRWLSGETTLQRLAQFARTLEPR